MANMSLKKNPMPSQDPNVRNKNFDEVALGYTEEMAIDEAQRCLNCKNPKCVNGCPVNVHIPEFIAKVAEGKFDEAFGVITSTNSLPAICGRVCPQENQCEGQCVRGIKGEPVGIGRLERFVADYHNTHGHQGGAPAVPESNGHKVAVVGSGPAGLTCAGDLARKGYDVTVFEALHQVGGVLVYGIPEFRLPKAIVAKEVARLEHVGVKIMTDTVVGRGCVVDETVAVEACIDDGATCGPRAYLRPGTHMLDGSKAGTHVEIKKSTIGEGSKVPHLSYIGDTTMGSGVNVGAGSITCNYDGVHKHKTVIGKDAFIGSDTMMVAPAQIGDGALVAAGSVITEPVPADALGLGRARQVNIEGWAADYRRRLHEDDEV